MKWQRKLCVGLVAAGVCLWTAVSVQGMNPSDEERFRSTLAKLEKGVSQLNEKLGVVFQPGAAQGKEHGEEIAWRMSDLVDKTKTMSSLSKDLWKNETAIAGVMDQWYEDAKLIDETMIYSPVTADVSDAWKLAKERALELRDFLEKMPAGDMGKEWEKTHKDFEFEIAKVGRYEKKQVLRERMKEFVGGSQLDTWPFAAECRTLDPKDFGEIFVVRFKVRAKDNVVLAVPLKLRFEYKFVTHQKDGEEVKVYDNMAAGDVDYTFKNLGEKFTARGKIIHWRASLLLNDKVIAQKKSPMWTVVSE